MLAVRQGRHVSVVNFLRCKFDLFQIALYQLSFFFHFPIYAASGCLSQLNLHSSASDSVGLIVTRSYLSTLLITTITSTPSLVKTNLSVTLMFIFFYFHTDFSVKGCADMLYAGFNHSDVYTISPDRRTEMEVFCDQETDNGGWIVFQRRVDASVSFHRTWEDYKRGFGNPKGNFWLGNDNIHLITSSSKVSLRIDLEDWSGKRVFARYENFKIGKENSRYLISVSEYNGTSGDSLSYHNNMMFSTRDVDNDNWKTGSCSNDLSGGWWFNDCHNSNLNGKFLGNAKAYNGIGWASFQHNLSLKFVEMKVREQSFEKEREDNKK